MLRLLHQMLIQELLRQLVQPIRGLLTTLPHPQLNPNPNSNPNSNSPNHRLTMQPLHISQDWPILATSLLCFWESSMIIRLTHKLERRFKPNVNKLLEICSAI